MQETKDQLDYYLTRPGRVLNALVWQAGRLGCLSMQGQCPRLPGGKALTM